MATSGWSYAGAIITPIAIGGTPVCLVVSNEDSAVGPESAAYIPAVFPAKTLPKAPDCIMAAPMAAPRKSLRRMRDSSHNHLNRSIHNFTNVRVRYIQYRINQRMV